MGIMAFMKLIDTAAGKLGIWELTDSSEKLAENFSFSETEKKEFGQLKNEKRKKEYLAVRLLLENMMHTKAEIEYDRNGKPHIKGSSLHISISHSPELAVILLSEKKAGVDAENIYRNTESIATRFLSGKEIENTQNTSNPALSRIMYWSAKEAAIKYSGMAEIELKSDLFVYFFHPEPEGGKFSGGICKDGPVTNLTFHYFFYEKNVIVTCIEDKK
ncbi:4-phosphopantetheinyl transferase family protein [Mariniphaga sediminis]|uniref:4-phosphopantetheinyl transferase family protein n=2 Tax=Mariniphaga sediminis TaxID=1628158 RepID=A0A399CZH9_9BACT|nr:4-phosphopantetheinyl transferase family protein [Mariniphaga sediminis]